ncbi:hypothetical protein DS830_06810 [Bombilactobacillus bombi]|uniref:hypothetical protein n=1 Tax=Bombilactobacillus bombi TaxID=1303590 RepID=UPI000E594AC6|nr:hypothetical protein [Bombilactobacillus bombi]AXX65201.1 hypothetical protein DS830_06810 [Bombilactobacillus bombi]
MTMNHKITSYMSSTILGVFLILVCNLTIVRADSFQDIINNRNILLRAGGPTIFDGDEYQKFTDVFGKWDFLDGRNKQTTEDFSNFVEIKDVNNPDTDYIPRKYSDLTLSAPANFAQYDPTNPDNKDKTKPDNVYTNIDNFLFSNNLWAWQSPFQNGFLIKDHRKPASFIIKKVGFYRGKWVDAVYTFTLEGTNGNTNQNSPIGWDRTNSTADAWMNFVRIDPNTLAIPRNDNADVYFNLGAPGNPNTLNWLNPVSYTTVASRKMRNNNPEASRWIIDIKFVYDRSTKANPTPNEKNDTPIDASGNFQVFNVNERKIYAFDKADLDTLGTGDGNRLLLINNGVTYGQNSNGKKSVISGTPTQVKGHQNTAPGAENYFEVSGVGIDNSGTRLDNGFLYLFNHGHLRVTDIFSGRGDTGGAMYTNMSNNATFRAEIPYTDFEGTTNNFGNVTDSSDEIVTSNKSKYSPQTVQFKIYQKLPPQPITPKPVAPSVVKVNNVEVPNYLSIDLSNIEISALNNSQLDSAVNGVPSLPQYKPQSLEESANPPAGKKVYNYKLDTSMVLGLAPGFNGFSNLFIKGDLNFKIDWDKKVNGEYPWKKDVTQIDGQDYVAAKMQGMNTDVFRKEGQVEKYHSITDSTNYLQDSYTSNVRVPNGTYNFKYVDNTNNRPINVNDPKNTTHPADVTSVVKEIGNSYNAITPDATDGPTPVPKYLNSFAKKDYLFEKAVLVDDKNNETPLTITDLTNLEFTYNNNQAKTIKVYYSPTVSRVTFQYAAVNNNKGSNILDPSNYFSSGSSSWPNNSPSLNLYSLKAHSTNGNYTIRSYVENGVNKDVPIAEELPINQPIVSPSTNPSDDGPITPPAKFQGEDSSKVKKVYSGSPAPQIKNYRYLGYYQYTVGTSQGVFHPYNIKEKDKTKNNAWAMGKYGADNQVIVFVYVSKDADNGLSVKTSNNIDFGKGFLEDLKRDNKNQANPVTVQIDDGFTYADKSMQWPDREWDLSVQADNFKLSNGTSMSVIPTIKFDKPSNIEYKSTGLKNEPTINDSFSTYLQSGFTLPLDKMEHQVLKVNGLKDTPNTLSGPTYKSESLKLTWNSNTIHLNVPKGVTIGKYSTKITWTIKNSIN